jgi:hypothetical protein
VSAHPSTLEVDPRGALPRTEHGRKYNDTLYHAGAATERQKLTEKLEAAAKK